MNRCVRLDLIAGTWLLLLGAAEAQTQTFPLESTDRLELHSVTAEPVTLEGRRGLRLTLPEETRRRVARLESVTPEEREKILTPEERARVRHGLPYLVSQLAVVQGLDFSNGTIEVERRNQSVQYISHPDWPWFRLRKETPGRYESYVDLVPGQRNDVKSGPGARGGVALWLEPGTVAHFRNLTVTPSAR